MPTRKPEHIINDLNKNIGKLVMSSGDVYRSGETAEIIGWFYMESEHRSVEPVDCYYYTIRFDNNETEFIPATDGVFDLFENSGYEFI